MKPELEALVLAFDAVRQARSGDEADRAEAITVPNSTTFRLGTPASCWTL